MHRYAMLHHSTRCLTLLLALVALPLRADETRNGITLPPDSDRVTLPLSRHFDIPAVSVTIAGQAAGRFLVDTGSNHTVVDKQLAARLKLATFTSAGDPPTLLAELPQLTLGHVPAGSRFAVVRDLSNLGPDVTGVLGIGALRDNPFTLDLRTPSLTLYRPGQLPDDVKSRGTPAPLHLVDGHPAVRASLDGRPGRFALDTATVGLQLTLVDTFALRDQDLRPQRRLGPDAPPATGRTRAGRLDLPGKSLDHLWANLVDRATPTGRRVPAGCVGVLGPGALRDARWTIDLASNAAWVEWPEPEPTDAYLRRLAEDQRTGTSPLPALLRAIDDRRPDAVQALLKPGTDPNPKPTWGSATLARAADSPEILKLLLAHHADAAAIGPDGRPPLLAAVESGNLDAVRLLLAATRLSSSKSGAPIDAPTPTGFTPLHRAAEADDVAIADALLTAHANPNAPSKDGTTPLILAAYNGSARVLDLLLNHDADARATTQLGFTALHAAAMSRRPEVAQRLLAAGADVNATAAADRATPLSVAALEDDPDCIRTLLAAGGSATTRLASGATPLSIAVSRAHVRSVQALLFKSPPALTLPANAPSATIPLAWCNANPCARVSINGQDAGWFLISLRTPSIVVDTKLARRLNLPRLGTGRPAIDPTDQAVELFETKDLAIENLSAGPRVVTTADLESLPFTAGKIAGVLGWPALFDQPITLDLRAPSLTVYRPGQLPPQATRAALPLRARFLPVGPAVWTRVHDETGWFRLDSRVRPGELLELTNAFATARTDLFRNQHLRSDFSLATGRPLERPVARLDTLSLAGQRIAPAPAAIAPPTNAPWPTTLDGLLALPTRDTRLTLDPQSGKAWIEFLPAEPLEPYLDRITKASTTGPLPQPPLLRAITDNRPPAVQALLDRGADPNAPDASALTPLMLAADRPELVAMLLAKNADPNATASFLGQTALLKAVESGSADSVRRLLAAGAKVDQPNTLGQTPLFRAAEADYPEIVDLLAAAGADLNRASREGWTPLTIAASRDSARSVAVLLRRGADPNLPAAGAATPLGVAAFKGHADTARLLIAARADVDRPTANGLTPLMAAAASNQLNVLRLLLRAGADASVRTPAGTAFDLATLQSNPDAMTMLKFDATPRP